MFITRSAPSKAFDVLSKDFSYMGLILTIVVLGGGIIVSKHYADLKDLRDAWI